MIAATNEKRINPNFFALILIALIISPKLKGDKILSHHPRRNIFFGIRGIILRREDKICSLLDKENKQLLNKSQEKFSLKMQNFQKKFGGAIALPRHLSNQSNYAVFICPFTHPVVTDLGRSIGAPIARFITNCEHIPIARDTLNSTV
jgi:hypothetical protein